VTLMILRTKNSTATSPNTEKIVQSDFGYNKRVSKTSLGQLCGVLMHHVIRL
jgi:hypothetical protein